jgi:hypothetical protein
MGLDNLLQVDAMESPDGSGDPGRSLLRCRAKS